MKKFFSILALFLFCSTWNSQAQQQTFNTPPKFKNVVRNDANTKILSINGSNLLQWVDKSTISEPVPNLQAVTGVGNTTTNPIILEKTGSSGNSNYLIVREDPNLTEKRTIVAPNQIVFVDNTVQYTSTLTYENGGAESTTNKLPQENGTLALSVDGVFADNFGNVSGIKPYKTYTALLSQSGTSAPTVVVLENSANLSFNFNRSSAGLYQLNLTSTAPPIQKVFFTLENMQMFSGITLNKEIGGGSIASVFQINTKLNGISTDELLNNSPLEIRIYD